MNIARLVVLNKLHEDLRCKQENLQGLDSLFLGCVGIVLTENVFFPEFGTPSNGWSL